MFADHGGHMIASQFNGIVEQINYFPQHPRTNTPGEWWRMEGEWATNLAQTVSVNIKPQFNGTSKRPYRFDVRFQYGNNQPVDRQILNPIR